MTQKGEGVWKCPKSVKYYLHGPQECLRYVSSKFMLPYKVSWRLLTFTSNNQLIDLPGYTATAVKGQNENICKQIKKLVNNYISK